jgi:hypothetical protein
MSDVSLTKYGKATADNKLRQAGLEVCSATKEAAAWRTGEKCTAFAKVKINGKCYCKRHGLLKIWNMLFVDKTHTLEVIKK